MVVEKMVSFEVWMAAWTGIQGFLLWGYQLLMCRQQLEWDSRFSPYGTFNLGCVIDIFNMIPGLLLMGLSTLDVWVTAWNRFQGFFLWGLQPWICGWQHELDSRAFPYGAFNLGYTDLSWILEVLPVRCWIYVGDSLNGNPGWMGFQVDPFTVIH